MTEHLAKGISVKTEDYGEMDGITRYDLCKFGQVASMS